jgi:hypothetical protein
MWIGVRAGTFFNFTGMCSRIKTPTADPVAPSFDVAEMSDLKMIFALEGSGAVR